MLQVSTLRENPKEIIKSLIRRNFKTAEESISQAIELDDNRKATQVQLDALLSESKNMAKKIGALMQNGKKEEAQEAKANTSELKQQAKTLDEKLKKITASLQDLLTTIPNIPHDLVPFGTSDEDNELVSEHGTIPNLYDKAKPHWELIKDYDIIDFDLGNKVSGAGFPFYIGKGARIQRALINFFLDEALAAGYQEVQPPILINEASGFGTGQLPDKEGQMYEATADKLYLIPTAEVPITNIYRDEIIKEDHLPLKNVAYSPCFRREAGSWGAHVRGLNRLHQFDKVEIVQVTKPEDSYAILDSMMKHVESLLKKLELPYRILRLCGGDLSFTSALTYDFEVFSAAQKMWLEVSSVSNFETYQANRLKLRYKVNGKTKLLHTLNGSALALPRILAAILENNQSSEGIKIPEVLKPYCGFDTIN